jgi:tRNA 2-selenouridine synthase
VVDVRSPAEYEHAHIPSACSLPLFNNEERAIVGTAYKQESKQQAIKLGLDIFGPKMRAMVTEIENLKAKKIFIYCWRGGMRSGGVGWLLDLYGFEVYQLKGGYKAYRNWALGVFEKKYNLTVLGGFTGSGKTYLLQNLEKAGVDIIDLEGIAQHKGSALGGINMPKQDAQELFENKLALALHDKLNASDILIEDESQRIGNLNVPAVFWNQMQISQVIFLEMPFENRLNFLVKEYGILPIEEIQAAVLRIQKRLGGLETKNALGYIEKGDLRSCFSILLAYYDKFYKKGLERKLHVKKVPTSTEDLTENTKLILEHLKK